MHLDATQPTLFGDGEYDLSDGASFSAQVRYFQPGPQYFVSADAAERPVASRLPRRYGYEESTVHTAKLSAMIASLKWRTQGAWNMFVGDRSALFAALRDAADPCSIWPSRGACLPLEGRLRAIMRRMAGSWAGGNDIPQWNEDLILNPGRWEVRIAVDPDPKLKWMSRISFNQNSIVGVDVKSHQTNTAILYHVITQGNDEQDSCCKSTNVKHRPPDIFFFSGVQRLLNDYYNPQPGHQSSALMATKLTQ